MAYLHEGHVSKAIQKHSNMFVRMLFLSCKMFYINLMKEK